MIERHLRRVNPSWPNWRLRQAVQDAFDSYTRYWIESLRLPSLSARTVAAGFDLVGFSHVTDGARARAPGSILALPHLGGWEWAGRWLADQGHRVTVIVERLEPPELFDWFVRLRSDLGMTVVPLGPGAGRAVLQALRDNEIVCLLCDRDIQGGGIEVEFFGERTTLPAGPATLGLRAGRADPARRRVLHAARQRSPRHRPPAAPRRAPRQAARRRHPDDPGTWPTSSSTSSAGPPSSGTCSSRTGRATRGTARNPRRAAPGRGAVSHGPLRGLVVPRSTRHATRGSRRLRLP